jgi:hypothetical protein
VMGGGLMGVGAVASGLMVSRARRKMEASTDSSKEAV